MVFAYMAQHVWEVGMCVLALVLIGQGLFLLIKGPDTPETRGMSEQGVRTRAWVVVLVGIGVGIAALSLDAEKPGTQSGNGWGGTTGIIFLCVWIALICAWPVYRLIKARSSSRER